MGLESGKIDTCFSTAFLMTYAEGRCDANCAFCPQARESESSSDRLSRIAWPVYNWDEIAGQFSDNTPFKRVCIQVLNTPDVIDEVERIIKELRIETSFPISVSIHPLTIDEMRRIHDVGATSIGIAFDACTESIFESVKGSVRGSSYRWDIGLGESEEEIAEFLKMMKSRNIRVGLFAFTNIRGTAMENQNPPALSKYRRIQVVHYLLANDIINEDQISIAEDGGIQITLPESRLKEILSSGAAFQTSGCKDCNRPYYNERPSGPLYNYPRPLSYDEVMEAIAATGMVK
jgi:biotin synthase